MIEIQISTSHIGKEQSKILLADVLYVYDASVDQGAYDPNTTNQAAAAQQSQHKAIHNRKSKSHEMYLGVVEGTKDLTIYNVGNNTLASLHKKYTGNGDTNPKGMIKHLQEEVCIKITTAEKEEFEHVG